MSRNGQAVMLRRAALTLIVGVLCLARVEAASCTVSTTSVSFGSYNVFAAAPTDSTATVTVRCTGSARNVLIGSSRGGASTYAGRRMVKGSEPLLYNLYLDAARTIVFGDGTSGTQVSILPDPTNNTNYSITIYARVPAGQDVSAGAYTDSLVVGVNF